MPRVCRRKIFALIAAGTAVRVAWAASTPGVGFDITSFRVAAATLLHHGLGFYGSVNPAGVVRWPYPPGYLPWTLAAHALAPVVGFRFTVALPAIAADAVLAFLAARALERAGASEKATLAAACLVSFGPIFALTSGFHGQIDSVAILPAAIAVDRWMRGGASRAMAAGVLVGVAASIKTPAGLVLLALLPTASSSREMRVVIGSAVAAFGITLAPFLLTTPHAAVQALNFAGIPGEGGLSLVVQPDLARMFLGSPLGVHASDATLFLTHHGVVLLAPLLLGVAVVARLRRVAPPAAAALLFLTVFVFGAGFEPRYAVWMLPFLPMGGSLRAALALQLALLGPDLAVYAGARSHALIVAYVIVGIAIWAAMAIWWLRSVHRLTTAGQPALPASSTARTAIRLPVAGTEIA